MLLEVKCTLEQYLDFLNQARKAGINPTFDMHGADENSSFSSWDSEFNNNMPTLEDLDENGICIRSKEFIETCTKESEDK